MLCGEFPKAEAADPGLWDQHPNAPDCGHPRDRFERNDRRTPGAIRSIAVRVNDGELTASKSRRLDLPRGSERALGILELRRRAGLYREALKSAGG